MLLSFVNRQSMVLQIYELRKESLWNVCFAHTFKPKTNTFLKINKTKNVQIKIDVLKFVDVGIRVKNFKTIFLKHAKSYTNSRDALSQTQ